ncbi:MAG: tRNA (N6-isopentenyl adenosine(37)-C2)-methylthiotransferase MiaB [Thermodesulfobacteriota bacterium]
MHTQTKAYYIETYGCQMNEHDSEKMAAILESMGLVETSTAETADVVIINTCSIREKAEHKVYSALGSLRALKAKNPGLVTVVAGCVAQQEKDRLLRRADHLDAVVGTHGIGELRDILERAWEKRDRCARTEFSRDVSSLHMPAPRRGRSPMNSYVTIMQGCSNFCTYCVVPYTRGPEQSRPAGEIVAEVQDLARQGVREVTLLGQNVNAYGKDRGDVSFAELLRLLDLVEGLKRIRFTTSHPKDLDAALVQAMAELGSVCEHIHLPLQSGSDKVLHAMHRGYTRAEYLEKIAMLRENIPGIAITADMIVGFPGETEEDFSLTLSALAEIRYDQIFSFKYSARPSTAARLFGDQIPEAVKAARLAEVHALQESITDQYHKAAEGTAAEVLIEGFRERSSQAFGRTRQNKIVNIEAPDGLNVGDLVTVRIEQGLKHSLRGKISFVVTVHREEEGSPQRRREHRE